MSYLSYRSSEWEWELESRPAGSADGTAAVPHISNALSGVVISKQEGLTRTTVRVRVSDRTDLRVRWPKFTRQHGDLRVGSAVRFSIPETAVQLEAGGFRRGKQRWNRWIGRVVLVQQDGGDTVTTVKIHRDGITLKSRGPIIGAQSPLTTWDTVNIVVDPEQINLTPVVRPPSSSLPSERHVPSAPQFDLVWIPAFVCAWRQTSDGFRGTLRVGDFELCVIIEDSVADLTVWESGITVEFSINSNGTWIRRNSTTSPLPCRISPSSDVKTPQPSLSRLS